LYLGVAYLRELTGALAIAADRNEAARKMAAELGADLVLDSNEDTVEAVQVATGGLGVGAVFDFHQIGEAYHALHEGTVEGRAVIRPE